MRDNGAPAVVCEDDACLRGDFVEQARALLAHLEPDWDIVFFGYNTNALLATSTRDGLKSLQRFDDGAKKEPNFFNRFSRSTQPPAALLRCFQVWGTLCYAISPNGAKRLLKTCFPLNAATEAVMFGQDRKLRPYTLDGMINVALQRHPIAAHCVFPPLALSPHDKASSDVASKPQ